MLEPAIYTVLISDYAGFGIIVSADIHGIGAAGMERTAARHLQKIGWLSFNDG